MMTMKLPLRGAPAVLVLIADGRLALVPTFGPKFPGVSDALVTGEVAGSFFEDCFSFTDGVTTEEHAWNTAYHYKQLPLLHRWLVQQKLELP